jgi:hypothetical protein
LKSINLIGLLADQIFKKIEKSTDFNCIGTVELAKLAIEALECVLDEEGTTLTSDCLSLTVHGPNIRFYDVSDFVLRQIIREKNFQLLESSLRY